MDRNQKFETILSCLKESETEDGIIECLTKMVKGFNIDAYREVIYSNTYFHSLIVDIKVTVLSEICSIRKSIQEEIVEIDQELKNNNECFDKLSELRKDCLLLLHELDQKEIEIGQL